MALCLLHKNVPAPAGLTAGKCMRVHLCFVCVCVCMCVYVCVCVCVCFVCARARARDFHCALSERSKKRSSKACRTSTGDPNSKRRHPSLLCKQHDRYCFRVGWLTVWWDREGSKMVCAWVLCAWVLLGGIRVVLCVGGGRGGGGKHQRPNLCSAVSTTMQCSMQFPHLCPHAPGFAV